MEVKIKGSDKAVSKFLKMNSLFMKRNKLEIVSESDEDLNKAPIEAKEPRKRRTKEEMEAAKNKG